MDHHTSLWSLKGDKEHLDSNILCIGVFTQSEFPAAEGNGVLSPAGLAETKGILLSIFANKHMVVWIDGAIMHLDLTAREFTRTHKEPDHSYWPLFEGNIMFLFTVTPLI